MVATYDVTSPTVAVSNAAVPNSMSSFGYEKPDIQSVTIPITSKYIELTYSTGTNLSVFSGFTVNWTPDSSNSDSSNLLAKVVSIIAVTLLIVICCGCCGICCYKIFHSIRSGARYQISARVSPVTRARRRYNEVPRDQSVIVISEENIDAIIPKKKYHKDLLEVGEAVCTICIDEFQSGIEVRKLPCKHLFHSKCIEEWFASNGNVPNCPMCKLNPFQTVIDAHFSSGQNELGPDPNSLMLRSDEEFVP